MSELNKVFDAPTREAKRKILDNYPISADDKNKFLNKVGNGGGETSNWRYFDLSKIKYVDATIVLGMAAAFIKFYDNNKNKFFIATAGVFAMNNISLTFTKMIVAIDLNAVISYIYSDIEIQAITAQELLNGWNIPESKITVGEITKEEFYSLE